MKETIQQTEGLCKEAATNIRNAYDKGYKQGYADGEKASKAVFTSGILKGREEAWECAREIVGDMVEPHFESAYMVDIFGCESAITAMTNNSATEAISKIKEYEGKKKSEDRIRVGDEVSDGFDVSGVVTMITPVKIAYVLWHDGSGGRRDFDDLKKTGRHFDAIPEVLGKLAGVNHDD